MAGPYRTPSRPAIFRWSGGWLEKLGCFFYGHERWAPEEDPFCCWCGAELVFEVP